MCEKRRRRERKGEIGNDDLPLGTITRKPEINYASHLGGIAERKGANEEDDKNGKGPVYAEYLGQTPARLQSDG